MVCLDSKSNVNKIVNNYWYFTWYSFIASLQILCWFSSYSIFIKPIVRLFTLNKYTFITINNYPLLSVSVKEIWSKRYNHFVRGILHQNIFKPLIENGYSKQFAAFMTFFMSGVLHVYISWKQLGNGLIYTLCFFVLHGIICIAEMFVYGKKIKRRKLSNSEVVWRILITNFIFAFTLPLYVGLYVREYPEYGTIVKETIGEYAFINNYLPSLQCVYPN